MIRNRKIILLGRLFVWTVVAVNAGIMSRSEQIAVINPSFSEKKLKSVLRKYKRSILVGLFTVFGIGLEIYNSHSLLYWHRIKLEILRKFLDQVSLFVFMAFQDYAMHPQEEPVLAGFLDGALNEISIIFAVFRDETPSRKHRNLILYNGYAVLKANNFQLDLKELSILYDLVKCFLVTVPADKANLRTFYTILFSWIDIDSLPVRGSIFHRSPFVVRALCLKMLNKLHSERFRNRTHDSYSLASLIRGGGQIFCAVSNFFVIKISTIALLIIALKLSEVTPVAPQKITLGVSQEIVTVSLFPYLCQSTNQENVETNQENVEATSKQRPEGTGTSASVERKKRQRRNRRRVNTLFSVEQDLIEEEKALRADKGNPPKTDLEEEDENSSNYFPRSYTERVRERVRIKKD